MDDMDRTVSSDIKVDFEATLTTSIVIHNYWETREDLLRDAPPGEIVLSQSKPIPVKTTYDGATSPQMIKVGIKAINCGGPNPFITFGSSSSAVTRAYIKNESHDDMRILRGSVRISETYGDRESEVKKFNLMTLSIVPGGMWESQIIDRFRFGADKSDLRLELKLTGNFCKSYIGALHFLSFCTVLISFLILCFSWFVYSLQGSR